MKTKNRPLKNPSSDSDSDSSDAEEAARLIEAAVTVTDVGFENRKSRYETLSLLKTECKRDVPPSLRQKSEDNPQDQNELNTTPEFRAHVAKKLSQILDSSVDMVKGRGSLPNTGGSTSHLSGLSESPGVKLFSSSAHAVDTSPVPESNSRWRTKRIDTSSDSDSESEMEKFAAAAVSGSDVLKQAGFYCGKDISETRRVDKVDGNSGSESGSDGEVTLDVQTDKNQVKQKSSEFKKTKGKKTKKKGKNEPEISDSESEVKEEKVQNKKRVKKNVLESVIDSDSGGTDTKNDVKKVKTEMEPKSLDSNYSSSELKRKSKKFKCKKSRKSNDIVSDNFVKKKKHKRKTEEGDEVTGKMYGKKKKCKHRHSEKHD